VPLRCGILFFGPLLIGDVLHPGDSEQAAAKRAEPGVLWLATVPYIFAVGLALFTHVILQLKRGSIDDSQYGVHVTNLTPGSECSPTLQSKHGSIDDTQYSPCNQSDTRE
jgi:hypothetical protein